MQQAQILKIKNLNHIIFKSKQSQPSYNIVSITSTANNEFIPRQDTSAQIQNPQP